MSDDDLEQSLAEFGKEWGKGPDKIYIGHVELLLQKTYKDVQIVTIAVNLIESTGFTRWTSLNGTERTRRRKLG